MRGCESGTGGSKEEQASSTDGSHGTSTSVQEGTFARASAFPFATSLPRALGGVELPQAPRMGSSRATAAALPTACKSAGQATSEAAASCSELL